jgi:hypothetical protein
MRIKKKRKKKRGYIECYIKRMNEKRYEKNEEIKGKKDTEKLLKEQAKEKN